MSRTKCVTVTKTENDRFIISALRTDESASDLAPQWVATSTREISKFVAAAFDFEDQRERAFKSSLTTSVSMPWGRDDE